MDTTLAPATPDTVTTARDRLIGRLAWLSAWVALVLGQLHALARIGTEDGRSDLELATVRWWAEPAADLLSPLLTWAHPNVVYVTYGKLWLPLFVAFTAGAFVGYRHRRPSGFEKWLWRVVLASYVGACLAVNGEYWTQWGTEANALLDIAFVASIPVMLTMVLGSTVLGVTLLVKRYRPRAAAVLLTCMLPGFIVIPYFTALGNIVLPVAFAVGVVGRRIAASD